MHSTKLNTAWWKTVWGKNGKAFEDQKRQKCVFRITTLMLTKRKRKVKTQPVEKKPRLASGQSGERLNNGSRTSFLKTNS